MMDKTFLGYFTQGKITITLHFLELITRKYKNFRQITNTQKKLNIYFKSTITLLVILMKFRISDKSRQSINMINNLGTPI